MGPLADFKGVQNQPEKQNKLKWLDGTFQDQNTEETRKKLRTNASEDDLVLKEDPGVVDLHRIKPQPKRITKITFSDDLYAPILTHLRELTAEEKEERIKIQKKQHEDMV